MKLPHYQALIDRSRVEHAVAAAAREAAATIDAAYIVAFTDSGATVRQVSRMRPRCGIFGFTTSDHVYRRLALRWGVRPMRIRRFRTTDRMLSRALDQLRSERDTSPPVTGSFWSAAPHQLSGATNMMKVETCLGTPVFKVDRRPPEGGRADSRRRVESS